MRPPALSAVLKGRYVPGAAALQLSDDWQSIADGSGYVGGETPPDCSARWPADRWSGLADGRYVLAGIHRDGKLLLGRAPSGALPLYWHRDRGGAVAFATTLDTLIGMLPHRPRWSEAGLDEYLRFLDIAPPATVYEGIFALRAGQVIEIDASSAKVREQNGPRPAPPASYEEACDDVESALGVAIDEALADSRAPACFLSGGIDSALLCALASRRGHTISAWTVGFRDPELDESAIARRIATYLGVDHHVLIPDTTALLDVFRRAHIDAEQPYSDPAGLPTRLLFEACARVADRVLDGTGAEALPGLMPPRWRRIAHDWFARLPRPARHALREGMLRLPRLKGYARMLDFDHAGDLYIRWNGFRADEIAALTGRTADLSGTHFFRSHAAMQGASHLMLQSILQGEAAPDDRLQQAARATGLALEQPFATTRLQRLLRGMPEQWCWTPQRPKRLLRDLLARQVPEALWDMPKRGFNIDLVALLRADDHRLIREHLSRPATALPLDPIEVAGWRDRFIGGDGRCVHKVWGLVNLAAWMHARNATSSRAADNGTRLQ